MRMLISWNNLISWKEDYDKEAWGLPEFDVINNTSKDHFYPQNNT